MDLWGNEQVCTWVNVTSFISGKWASRVALFGNAVFAKC